MDRLIEQLSIVFVAHQEAVHFGDGDSVVVVTDQLERVACGYLTFRFDGKVKAAAAAVQESLQDVVSLEFRR